MDRAWELDEDQQRRLVLLAAREVAPRQYARLLSNPPTLTELDRQFHRGTVAFLVLSVLTLAVPCLFFLAPTLWALTVAPLRKTRNHVLRCRRQLLTEADPEIDLAVLTGGIRRRLKSLSQEQREQQERVTTELARSESLWRELGSKLAQVETILNAADPEELAHRRAMVEARIELEDDPVVRASLQRQLSAVEGRVATLQSAQLWRSRLSAARSECVESLEELRGQLVLLGAAGTPAQQAAVHDAAEGLRDLNRNLSATQAATEEVLRLGFA